jgi:tetratricopeptide (TPR) repeat protein
VIGALVLALAACASATQASQALSTAARVQTALSRDPSTLPRAASGKWSSWTAFDSIPKELAPALGAGIHAYSAGDYGPALAQLVALLEHEPDYPPALYQAGLCYFRLRRYRDCATLIERFVEVAPKEVGAAQVLGHCYYSLGDYERAKRTYEAVVAASPQSAEALRGFGLTELKLGNPTRALELLQKVVELKPDHADAHAWIAQVLFDLGRSEESLAAAQRAKELDPFEPRPWFLESQALLDLGREEDAQKSRARFDELSRATQTIRQIEGELLHDPHQIEPMKRLIAAQASIGDRAAVRESFARLWRTKPNDVELRIFALDTFEAMHDEDGARQAALDLERECAQEASAWKRLETYYISVRDRVRQVQAAERYLRLRGDVKNPDK